MTNSLEFRPDWVSAPGDTIADILKEREVSVAEFAQRIGHTKQDTADLLQGRATITIRVARLLERALGASVEFWMSRDYQYRQDMGNLYEGDKNWLAELPVGDMIKFGWIDPVPRPSEELDACLRFFDVPSLASWRKTYAGTEKALAFRTSPSFDSRPGAVLAWLRQGEIEAKKIRCEAWNVNRFKRSLAEIRSLTRKKDPAFFLPELTKRCAKNGVALAIVRAPAGCRASGATRFLKPTKALLLLSFRYLTDDHFWFTFFHEAGHLVLHGKKSLFLEAADTSLSAEEEEANEFAARTLIPTEFLPELLRLPANRREVIRFARRLGVSPGIVVGQLQHLGKIKPNWLNGLKRRYTWGN